MSNLLASAEQVRSQGMLFAPAGGAKVAMIDARDVAAVAAVALTSEGHEGQAYMLTGPEAISFEHVAEALSAVTGRRVVFVDVPDDAARQGMIAAGMPQWLAEQLVVLFEKLRQGAAEQTTDTVLALTGRAPRTFTEFAHDHAALFSA